MKIPIKEIIKAEKFLNRYGISLFLYGYSLDGTEEYAEEYIKSVSNKKELSKSEYEKFRKYVMKTCGNRVSIAYINILMKVLLEGNYPNKLLFDYCSNNFNDDYLQSWFETHPRYNHKGNGLGSIILSYFDNFFYVKKSDIFMADGRLNPLLYNDGDLDDDDYKNEKIDSEPSIAIEKDNNDNVYDTSRNLDDEFLKRIISSIIDKTNSHFMIGKSAWEKFCYPIYETFNNDNMRDINVVIIFGKMGKDFIKMNEYIEQTSFTNATIVYALRTSILHFYESSILNLDKILSKDKYNLVIVDSNVKAEYIPYIDKLSHIFDTTVIITV